jgi:hypothetical protein
MTSDLDQAFSRIENLARQRSLSGTARSMRHGTPALEVGGNCFVRLKDATTLVLHCPPEQKALLMDIWPEIYFETEHYVGHPVVLVHLDAIGDEELALRLEDAWQFRQ